MAFYPCHRLLSSLPAPLVGPAVSPLAGLQPSIACPELVSAAQHLLQVQLAAAVAELQAYAQVTECMQWMELGTQSQHAEHVKEAVLPPSLPVSLTLCRTAGSLAVLAPAVQQEEIAALPNSKVAPGKPVNGSRGSHAQSSKARGATTHQGSGQKVSKETLRGYLQEVCTQDPSCVFITRRINKLGFRSRALLERHYSQYGEVVQVFVAHSTVKPFPNSNLCPRTRPGNFGLVVMKTHDRVQAILLQGRVQVVSGVEIEVSIFEQVKMERDFEAFSRSEELGAEATRPTTGPRAARGGSSADSSLTSSGRSSGHGTAAEQQWQEGDWSQQLASSSGGSEDGGPTAPRAAAARAAAEWQRPRCGPGAPWSTPAGCSASQSSGQTSNGSDAGAQVSRPKRHVRLPHASAHEASEGGAAAPAPAQQLDELDVQLLGQWARSYTPALPSCATAPTSSYSSLALVLNEMSQISKVCNFINSFTREQTIQAAALAQCAQQSLKRLEEECQEKIKELTHVRPAPGLQAAAAAAALSAWPQAEAEALPREAEPRLRGSAAVSLAASAAPTAPSGNPDVAARAAAGASPTGVRKAAPGAARCGSAAGPQHARPAVSPAAFAAADGPGAAPRRSRARPLEPGTDQRDSLRIHLAELSTEDPRCIFITRRISKLGTHSREILQQHFSHYGEVSRVLVTQPIAKPFRDCSGQFHTRSSGLGFVVMRKALDAENVLALGEEQTVAGHQIRVRCFERPKLDDTGLSALKSYAVGGQPARPSCAGSSDSGAPCRGQAPHGQAGAAGGGSSEEGGPSTDACEKSAAEAGSSGGESLEGGAPR